MQEICIIDEIFMQLLFDFLQTTSENAFADSAIMTERPSFAASPSWTGIFTCRYAKTPSEKLPRPL